MYLDPNDHYTRQLVDSFQSIANEQSELNLVSTLKLFPVQVDGLYIFKWGHLVGHGKTVREAVQDFNNNYYKK